MANGTRVSQSAVKIISRCRSQTTRRPTSRPCLNSPKIQTTLPPRLITLPAHIKPFSTSRSLSEKPRFQKWLEEEAAKLDVELKEQEDVNAALDFAMRSKGYSEGAIRAIHGVAWAVTLSIFVAIVAGISWGLKELEIWPFGSSESDKSKEEIKPQSEGAWNGEDE